MTNNNTSGGTLDWDELHDYVLAHGVSGELTPGERLIAVAAWASDPNYAKIAAELVWRRTEDASDTRDNRTRFVETLTAQYVDLFETDPEYAYSASRISPAALAEKMTASLIDNTANHEGAGLRRTCKALGIKPTRAAMRAYLTEPTP